MNARMPTFRRSLLAAAVLSAAVGCGRPPAVVDLGVGAVSVAAEQPAPARADPPARAPVLPNDQGGQAVKELLTPAGGREPAQPVTAPVPLALPRGLAEPALPPAQVDLPRRPLTPREKLRPKSPAEDPLALDPSIPPVPNRPTQPTRALVRVSSPNANEPTPLAVVGQQVPDRVPLDDPTADASLQAALATGVPVRTTPVPFAPTPATDPFQHGEVVRVRVPPTEDHQPPKR